MHGETVIPEQRVSDLPMVAIDKLRSRRGFIDFVEQRRASCLIHALDPDGRCGIEIERRFSGHGVGMHQRMRDGWCLLLCFLGDDLVDIQPASRFT